MKKSKRDSINLFFSAFLITAYIICGYFFTSFAAQLGGEPLKNAVLAVIVVIFGLLVFYATRVGEGKAVKRFSLVTLILLDIPALLILLAFVISGMPFHEELVNAQPVVYMAALALGYGLPYTFLSGFELASEKEEEPAAESKALEGGVEADILDGAEPEEPTYEPETEEIVVDGAEVVDEVEELDNSKE
jgi:hypothetical protein